MKLLYLFLCILGFLGIPSIIGIILEKYSPIYDSEPFCIRWLEGFGIFITIGFLFFILCLLVY